MPSKSLTISIVPGLVARVLVIWALFLALLGAVSHYVTWWIVPTLEGLYAQGLEAGMRRIGNEVEPSLAHWYSSLALLSCAFLLGLIALAKFRQRDRRFVPWTLLAALFCFLAVDEGIEIHELANGFGRALGTRGALHWVWVVPYGLFFVAVAAAFFKFVFQLPARTRWLFIVAGTTYVTGALGMEMLGGIFFDRYGYASMSYLCTMVTEELLEMLGTITMIYALLSYISTNLGTVQLVFASPGANANGEFQSDSFETIDESRVVETERVS